MLLRTKRKARPGSLLATVTPRVDPPIIITGRNGLSHKTTLSRLKCGLKLASDPFILEETANALWCGGRWTSAELRALLVQKVAEGVPLQDVLESMRVSIPPMPSYDKIREWLSKFKDFKTAYRAAEKTRAKMSKAGRLRRKQDCVVVRPNPMAAMSAEGLDRRVGVLLAEALPATEVVPPMVGLIFGPSLEG